MITISPQVSEGLDYIFSSDVNHYNRSDVINELTVKGYYEAALWVKNHDQEYALGLGIGFHVKEENSA